jgi:hypothetical protein
LASTTAELACEAAKKRALPSAVPPKNSESGQLVQMDKGKLIFYK